MNRFLLKAHEVSPPKKTPSQCEHQPGEARVSHRRRETTSVALGGFLACVALVTGLINLGSELRAIKNHIGRNATDAPIADSLHGEPKVFCDL